MVTVRGLRGSREDHKLQFARTGADTNAALPSNVAYLYRSYPAAWGEPREGRVA